MPGSASVTREIASANRLKQTKLHPLERVRSALLNYSKDGRYLNKIRILFKEEEAQVTDKQSTVHST